MTRDYFVLSDGETIVYKGDDFETMMAHLPENDRGKRHFLTYFHILGENPESQWAAVRRYEGITRDGESMRSKDESAIRFPLRHLKFFLEFPQTLEELANVHEREPYE